METTVEFPVIIAPYTQLESQYWVRWTVCQSTQAVWMAFAVHVTDSPINSFDSQISVYKNVLKIPVLFVSSDAHRCDPVVSFPLYIPYKRWRYQQLLHTRLPGLSYTTFYCNFINVLHNTCHHGGITWNSKIMSASKMMLQFNDWWYD